MSAWRILVSEEALRKRSDAEALGARRVCSERNVHSEGLSIGGRAKRAFGAQVSRCLLERNYVPRIADESMRLTPRPAQLHVFLIRALRADSKDVVNRTWQVRATITP